MYVTSRNLDLEKRFPARSSHLQLLLSFVKDRYDLLHYVAITIGITVVLCLASSFFLFLRLYVLVKSRKGWKIVFTAPVWTLLIAWFTIMASTVLLHICDYHGFGLEYPFMEQLSFALKMQWFQFLTYFVGVNLTRISLALTYRTVYLDTKSRWCLLASTFLIWLIAMTAAAEIAGLLMSCSPISAYWTTSDSPSYCYTLEQANMLLAGSSALFCSGDEESN